MYKLFKDGSAYAKQKLSFDWFKPIKQHTVAWGRKN